METVTAYTAWYLSKSGFIVAELSEETDLSHAHRVGETTEVPFIALGRSSRRGAPPL